MAVDGGDIRFTFTGDSSGLNSELKKIDKNLGEVSKATAGASNGMEKGLVKGAKAADKAAARMTGTIVKAKTEMDQAAFSARKMGSQMDTVADGAGRTDSSLAAVGGALNELSPEMADMAGKAGAAAGALEGIIIAAKEHPQAAAAVAVATAAMALAFHEATKRMEEQEDALKRLDRRQDKTIRKLEDHKALQDEVEAAFDATSTQIEETSKSYFEMEERILRTTAALRDQIKQQRIQGDISEQSMKQQLAAANQRESEMLATAKITAERLEEERIIDNERKIRAEQRAAAEKAAARAAKRRAEEEAEIAAARAKQEAELAAQEAERQAETEKRAALELAAMQQFDKMLMDTGRAMLTDSQLAEAIADDKRQAVISLTDTMSEEQKKQAAIEQKQAWLLEQIEQEKQDKIADIQDKARDEQRDKDIKARNDALTASSEITSGILEVSAALEEEFANASIEERQRLFNIQKGASIADATINGAVAITRALADLGPIAGAVAAAAITATTAAQISLIAQQEPAFDTGGIVRGGLMANSGDQMSARVLPGEAILNRSATDRIGEQGINALNGGAGLGGVTVVPAYRHFDRFIRDEYRKGGSFRRIVTREREFPVGQRRY